MKFLRSAFKSRCLTTVSMLRVLDIISFMLGEIFPEPLIAAPFTVASTFLRLTRFMLPSASIVALGTSTKSTAFTFLAVSFAERFESVMLPFALRLAVPMLAMFPAFMLSALMFAVIAAVLRLPLMPALPLTLPEIGIDLS